MTEATSAAGRQNSNAGVQGKPGSAPGASSGTSVPQEAIPSAFLKTKPISDTAVMF